MEAYFDNSATTRCSDAPVALMQQVLLEAYGSEIRDGFFSFRERYEVVKQFDYRTRKWR